MPAVNDIHRFLQTLAPEETAEDWDHVGLLCGRLTVGSVSWVPTWIWFREQ